MSYDTLKNGIANLVKSLGYMESSQSQDFEDAPEGQLGSTFILKCISGEVTVESGTLIDRFYDRQVWQVLIAFSKSEQNDSIILDDIHRKKDLALLKLDEPANWSTFVTVLKYKKWEILEFPNYFVLSIVLDVIDKYIYT